MNHSPLLEVRNLCLGFPNRNSYKEILKDLSFTVRRGEILGLIGNSGSGKSITSLAISDLLPKEAEITGGEIIFDGNDLLKMKSRDRRKLLGRDIGIVFQEPKTALDPLMRIGRNLCDGTEYPLSDPGKSCGAPFDHDTVLDPWKGIHRVPDDHGNDRILCDAVLCRESAGCVRLHLLLYHSDGQSGRGCHSAEYRA